MNQVTEAHALLESIKAQAETGTFAHPDDTAFFAPGRVVSTDVRERILIERAVIRSAVAALLADGRSITVYHEGVASEAIRCRDLDTIMGEVGACDCETLGVFTPGIIGRYGFISLVHGNDGWDVMQDCSSKLCSVLERTDALASAIGEAL